MIPEAILTALFVGWLLHGRFSRLADVRINYVWMLFVPLGLYAASVAANYAHVFRPNSWVFGLVHGVGLVALLVLTLGNRNIAGVKIMFAGLAANAVATFSNGGFMPTSGEAIAAVWGKDVLAQVVNEPMVRHALIDAGTRFSFLCDTIAAPRPFVFFQSVYSVGDLLLSVGGLIAIIAIMRTPLPVERSVRAEARSGGT